MTFELRPDIGKAAIDRGRAGARAVGSKYKALRPDRALSVERQERSSG